MSENLPVAVKSGFVQLSPNHKIEVHVLDDGRRIIEASSLKVFLDWIESNCFDEVTADGADRLARAIKLGEFDDA